MEGQLDAELRKQGGEKDSEGPAGMMSDDEWKSWQRGQVRRNTLHLVSAAAQWILLLACLIYLGIDSLQLWKPHSDKVPWTYIQYQGPSIAGVAMNLSAELGSIHIRNGSIMITCDGLYLVSLKGTFSPDSEEKGSLRLMVRKTENKNDIPVWEQDVSDGRDTDLITMLFLFAQDNITLATSLNATIEKLTFSLVLLKSIFCI